MGSQSHHKRLHRYEIPGGIRFLTFSCRHRLQLFSNNAIKELFMQRLAFIHAQERMAMIAWVVMSEHVHLLVRPIETRHSMATYLAGVKTRFAKQVVSRWVELDASILNRIQTKDGRFQFWQPGGGYDRNIVSSEEFVEKLNYIHQNPVKRGLVARPEDWRWSSAAFYLGKPYQGPVVTPIDPR